MELNFFLLVLLIIASGTFSGSESALFSLDLSQRETLKKMRDLRTRNKVRRILAWLSQPEKTIASILLGNLAVNIILTEVGHTTLAYYLNLEEDSLYLVSVISITVVVLIFGEILPKVFAISNARSFSLRLANFLSVWFAISRFFAWPVFRLARIIVNKLPEESGAFSEQELNDAVELADNHGIITQKEIRLLKRSISYLHDTSYDVMIPKSHLFMLPHDTTPTQAKKLFIEGQYLFAFIYHKKENNILGFIQTRNLLLALFNKQKTIKSAAQQILHLPETLPLNEVVEAFIHSKTEVAAVVNETGEVSGAITLKKILGKLLGERAEQQQKHSKIKQLSDFGVQTYRVMGTITLNDFNEFFHCNLLAENSETLSGFILEHLDGFPHEETVLKYENFEFFDMQVQNYLIEKLYLRVMP